MRTLKSALSAVLSLAVFAGPAAAQGAASLTRIGAAAAVRGAVRATAPGGQVGRVLSSGKPVFLNDHVTTDAEGRLQVMLLDETVFTLGPNSDMVLDEFVYDPNTNAGKVTAQVTKGVFRFVTGKVAGKEPSNMNVKLPVGTIGIRGTIVSGIIAGQISKLVLGGPGQHPASGEKPGAFDVLLGQQVKSVSKEGFGVTVGPGGISDPAPMPEVIGQVRAVTSGISNFGKGSDPVKNPGDDSGESAAKGAGPAAGVDEDIDVFVAADQGVLVFVNNDLAQMGNPFSKWEDMIKNLSGNATYSAGGTFTQTLCSGSPCSQSGNWGYGINVDFDSRSIAGSATIFGGSLTFSDSAPVSMSYGSLSGPAKFTATGSGGTYNFQFLDQAGVTAKQLQGTVTYNNTLSNNAGSGSMVTSTR